MRRNVLSVLMAGAATALLAGAAQAEGNNFYVGGSVGLNFLEDADSVSNTVAGGLRRVEEDFDTGAVISGFVGYSWDLAERGAVRLEGELSYRTNDTDSLVFNTAPQNVVSDDNESLSGFVNAYYDFTQFSDRFHPYLGAGIGFTHIDKNVVYGGGANINDEDTVFAYQFIAGVTYKATDQFDIFVEGRYLGTEDPDLDRFGGPGPAGAGGLGGALTTTQESEYESISASIGVRYRF
ncbi:outer membrane protein [Coralliovum pocilloporae]|uniref:outer membrane protein n=1 Tax=Coralliovum pocilloporae TaxID=3066369 RepID=UPI0033069FA3